MTDPLRTEAIALYDRFTHGGLERREFMARMVALAGSVAVAEALIGAIAASPAAAAIVPADDTRLTSRMAHTADGFEGYSAYISQLRTRSLKPTVLVIHENRGLNNHIKDIARRLGLAGYRAVAVDFLTGEGGTPADENKARDLIGKLDLSKVTSDAAKIVRLLAAGSRGGKVGAVGFCWGGGMVNRLAVAAGNALDAGVVYYGPAPAPAEAALVQAPLLIHLAGLDTRIAETEFQWIAALRTAGKPVTYFDYPGVNHAFNNDTSAERFDKAAAALAWGRTLRFFRRTLG